MSFADIRRSDVVLAVFVLAITAMLLVPLPTTLLDFLLAVNIAFSLLLLLVGLYMPNALALLAFPTLLLLTTLFRLGLNVASTRLILSQADAGSVIRAFGSFLIRGDLVVGAVIFVIITIVNFVVITRGSSRVSEVAARFALDALPGKQMAIDSELRSGLISADEARSKREDLRKESQLYGAMDGAMKFVQGDVIAGLFITMTNICGGLYQGVSRGQSLTDAIQTYSVLTVGDGLVSQVPALLISICAGIIVTRVSSGENTTLGSDVGRQLFAKPGTLMFAGVLVALIGLLPGLPWVPFITVAVIVGVVALYLRSVVSLRTPVNTRYSAKDSYAPHLSAGLGRYLNNEDGLRIVLDARQLYKHQRTVAMTYQQWWQQFSADYYLETGLSLPPLLVSADSSLVAGCYNVFLGQDLLFSGEAIADGLMLEVNPASAGVYGLEVIREELHPLTAGKVFWTRQSEVVKSIAVAADLRFWDFFQYISLKAGAYFRHHPEDLLSVTDVHVFLKQMEQKFPGLTEQIFREGFITVSRLTELLQELARQGLNIRDFQQILEAVASWFSALDISTVRDDEFSLQDLVAHVRTVRRKQMLTQQRGSLRALRVCTLAPEVQEIFENAIVDSQNSSIAIEPRIFEQLQSGISKTLKPFWNYGLLPVALLIPPELLFAVLRFVRCCDMSLAVFTFDELEPLVRVEQVGIWQLGQ